MEQTERPAPHVEINMRSNQSENQWAWRPWKGILLAINAPLLPCKWESTKMSCPSESTIISIAMKFATMMWNEDFFWSIECSMFSSWCNGCAPNTSNSCVIPPTWQSSPTAAIASSGETFTPCLSNSSSCMLFPILMASFNASCHSVLR